jgi:hypothetical protein
MATLITPNLANAKRSFKAAFWDKYPGIEGIGIVESSNALRVLVSNEQTLKRLPNEWEGCKVLLVRSQQAVAQ